MSSVLERVASKSAPAREDDICHVTESPDATVAYCGGATTRPGWDCDGDGTFSNGRCNGCGRINCDACSVLDEMQAVLG